MKKSAILFLLFFGTAFTAYYPFNNGLPNSQKRSIVLDRTAKVLPDRIIVKRSAGVPAKTSRNWEQALQKVTAMTVEAAFPSHAHDNDGLSRIFEVRLQQGTDVFAASETLMQDASVEWAEPVFIRRVNYNPGDPGIVNQWYLAKIKAFQAWDASRTSKNVIIAVVDNGINLTHPDLAANIWINTREIPDNGIDDDHNEYIDDVNGWDFGNNDNDPNPSKTSTEDLKWHGTEVSGLAGAVTDNGVGMASVSFNPKIMPVKTAMDADPLSIIAGAKGIVYAADNGAHIINCSFGSSSSSRAELEAVTHACSLGCLITSAAGNGGNDNIGPGEDVPSYPASLPGVLSVANTNEGDKLDYSSNYNYTVDVSAPGTDIYTLSGDRGYTTGEIGTSYSSPIAASIAALIKGLHPSWSGMQAGEQVRVSCVNIDAFNPSLKNKIGSGRVDAYRALTLKSPSVRLDTTILVEGSGSNMDGIYDPGEELLFTFTAINYLEPASSVTIVFSSTNPDVSLTNSTFFIPSLGTKQKWQNKSNPMKITISTSAARGQTVTISAAFQASGGYADRDRFDFDISHSYATLYGKNVGLTVTAMGRLGLVDIITERGDGFLYKDERNLLFEGAVLAGVAADSLSDVARGDGNDKQNEDFSTTPGGEIKIARPGILADEQGTTNFSDENAVSPLHLGVNLSALAFQDTVNADYVLLAYRLYNTSGTPIRKLYFGLFMDWDVTGIQDPWHNLAGYEPDLSLGYVYEQLSSVHGGLALVSRGGAGSYASIINKNEIYPGVGGYSKEKKWQHLSGGIRNVPGTGEADYSHVLGVGPLTINPRDTVLIGFAVVGGFGLDELKTHTRRAKAKWQALFEATSVTGTQEQAPSAFRLADAYPNPFNSGTVIRYELPRRAFIVLTVHDLLGREIARIVDSIQDAGVREARWDGSDASGRPVPSGMYVCRIRTDGWTQVRKLFLIR